MTDDGPYAEIMRQGRWTYAIRIVHGIVVYQAGTPWLAFGTRGHAERKARRLLARHCRNHHMRIRREVRWV